MILAGIEVRESLLATTTTSRRPHKKRRTQTDAYHARVSKKWLKRFGTISLPAAYKMREPWSGREIMVIHPTLMAKLRGVTVPTPTGAPKP